MKHSIKLLFAFALIFWGVNTAIAQTSIRDDKAMKAKEVQKQVNNKDFVFEATHAKGEGSLRYHKYDVAIAKDTLVANLPGVTRGPLKISSTDYAYNASKDNNGDWNIVIKPKAGLTDNVKQINMQVTPQGHASLHVITRSNGPLSLNGYIKQEDY